jgi:hypothetical protein
MKPEGRRAVRAPCIRGPAGPALVLLSSESFVLSTFPPALFIFFVLCFHRLLDGWEACTRCFAVSVIELDRLVV